MSTEGASWDIPMKLSGKRTENRTVIQRSIIFLRRPLFYLRCLYSSSVQTKIIGGWESGKINSNL